MRQGKVKWYNPTKGYGFIAPSDGTADIFVHVSVLEKCGIVGLAENQTVEFEINRDKRTGKVQASHVRLVA